MTRRVFFVFVIFLIALEARPDSVRVGPELLLVEPEFVRAEGAEIIRSIATDGEQFLVLWFHGESDFFSGTRRGQLRAKRYTPQGDDLNPAGIYLGTMNLGDTADVVWTGDRFIATWNEGNVVRVRSIWPGGVMHHVLDEVVEGVSSVAAASNGLSTLVVAGTKGFLIDEYDRSETVQLNVAGGNTRVASDGDVFLVAWTAGGSLSASRVSRRGEVVDAEPVRIADFVRAFDLVAGDQFRFLISRNGEIRTLGVSPELRPINETVIASEPADHPRITWNGRLYQSIWVSSARLRGASVTPEGVVVSGPQDLPHGGVIIGAELAATPFVTFISSWSGVCQPPNFQNSAPNCYYRAYGQSFDENFFPLLEAVEIPRLPVTAPPRELASDGRDFLALRDGSDFVFNDQGQRLGAVEVAGSNVSYGAGKYLAVEASSDHGIFGTLIDAEDLTVHRVEIQNPSPFQIWLRPATAFDGENFLVVWSRWSQLVVARVTPSGTVLDPAGRILIEHALPFAGSNEVSVAWNGDEYLVTWWSPLTPAGAICSERECVQRLAVRVGRDATLLDPVPRVLRRSLAVWAAPADAVAFGNGTYLLVWYESADRGVAPGRLLASRLDKDGVPLDPNPIDLGQSMRGNPLDPEVVWDGKRFLIAWSEKFERVLLYQIETSGQATKLAAIEGAHSPSLASRSDGTTALTYSRNTRGTPLYAYVRFIVPTSPRFRAVRR